MSTPLQHSVRWSRHAQHYLDLLLCLSLLALGMFAIHWNTDVEHSKAIQTVLNTNTQKNKKPQHPPSGTTVQWQHTVEANTNPLTAFDTWRVNQHIAQGHCELRLTAMTCFGVQQPHITLKPHAFEPLDILKVGKQASPSKSSTKPETIDFKQEGWVLTPQGKRYFNPRTERWVK
jgi:hypothetical protein